MSARGEILQRIRQSTVSMEEGTTPEVPVSIPVPAFRNLASMPLAERFTEMLNRVHGTITHVTRWDAIPEEVVRYLSSRSCVPEIVAASHPRLEPLDWGGLDVCFRAATREDVAAVSVAFAGIAETGTLVMISGKQSPTTLNFLPETHIVVLEADSLLSALEELWPVLERQPRSLNLITGPSKTADIEQTIIYGAHGPRFLHVIMISEQAASG